MNEIELKKEVSQVLIQANQIKIQNSQDCEFAGDFLQNVKTTQKKIIDFWEPLKAKAHQSWKGIVAQETEMLTPFKQAESMIKKQILEFQREEERKRIQEQMRLQREANEKAERERQAAIKAAEKLKTPELREERLAEAQTIEAPTVIVQSETPKITGLSTRKTWKAKVTDKTRFLLTAQKNDFLKECIEINESKLNRFAQVVKGVGNYPGLEFYEEETLAVRS